VCQYNKIIKTKGDGTMKIFFKKEQRVKRKMIIMEALEKEFCKLSTKLQMNSNLDSVHVNSSIKLSNESQIFLTKVK
jgi:hypothetical protein